MSQRSVKSVWRRRFRSIVLEDRPDRAVFSTSASASASCWSSRAARAIDPRGGKPLLSVLVDSRSVLSLDVVKPLVGTRGCRLGMAPSPAWPGLVGSCAAVAAGRALAEVAPIAAYDCVVSRGPEEARGRTLLATSADRRASCLLLPLGDSPAAVLASSKTGWPARQVVTAGAKRRATAAGPPSSETESRRFWPFPLEVSLMLPCSSPLAPKFATPLAEAVSGYPLESLCSTAADCGRGGVSPRSWTCELMTSSWNCNALRPDAPLLVPKFVGPRGRPATSSTAMYCPGRGWAARSRPCRSSCSQARSGPPGTAEAGL